MSHNDSNIKNPNKYFPWTMSIKNNTNGLINGLKISKSSVGINHYTNNNGKKEDGCRRYSNYFGIIEKSEKINCSKSGDVYDDVIMLWNKFDFDSGIAQCKMLAQSIYDHWLPDNDISCLIRHSNILNNVRLLDSYDSLNGIKGKLHITVTHLIFLSDDLTEEKWILIHLISSVDSPAVSSLGKTLIICLKDFHNYRFMIEDSNGCDKLKLVLLKLIANTDQHDKLPCFSGMYFKQIAQHSGWKIPHERLKASFQRMGIPNSQWKFTDINENYKMSDTYPSVIVIPEGTSKSIIESCSKFRSRGRFPALTYYYSPSKSAMCRCSQPLVGFSARCLEDIRMLKRIKDVASDGHTDKLHVVDTRPKINALTNRARGKGYESDIDYEKIVFQFFQIENIHVMRSSLEKLLKASINTKQSYLSFVEKSGWFRHIKWIMDASFYIAQKLKIGENVVVHCSDGWDRTSQVCGLTQIMLDPYYRTIEGLEDLIEKDWLSFGHKFNDRCGHLSTIEQSEVSPVFTQFLDCIYQLFTCFPNQFQYNERLLRHLHRWSQDCVFGTFVGNCEKDRLDLKTHVRTHSVWGYINAHLWDYMNPYYDTNVITPMLNGALKTSEFSFWRPLYCPIEDVNSINSCSVNIADNLFTMQQLTKSIRYQNDHLLNRSNQLIKLLSERNTQIIDNGRLSSALTKFAEIKQQMIVASGDHNNNTQDQEITINDWNQTLIEEMSSVAVDLPMIRRQISCNNCNHNLDKLMKMNFCYSCGQYYCGSCIRENVVLPGHGNISESFPVCLTCATKVGECWSKISHNNYMGNGIEQQKRNENNSIGSCLISDDPLMDIVLQASV